MGSYQCLNNFCLVLRTAHDADDKTCIHLCYINKQIHLVGKRFRLKIHQNTIDSYFY